METMKRPIGYALALLLILTASVAMSSSLEVGPGDVPVPGMVTMIDIGAKKCIPCKMMAPILDKLEVEYRGRAAIRFIDVWENPGAGKPFGIGLIPTQIFYDASGREQYRHEGFLAEDAIRAKLAQLGVK
ncbi:thioredoxin family protein [Desulfovibrio ferrophilus]|uniref:Thioredoxin domain-containing protein n=1 Tax=Desulfovibrio ferrophilus TaxID=241368 RepID=A0A2Z6B312_9BACT|nr:thioredoxin family protein [Desulfovibrio ferrophilus]BBD09882.1 thioredoxin domain-containing protein [Desulfovibrio ferrophilus]